MAKHDIVKESDQTVEEELKENLIKSNFTMGRIADSLEQIQITFGNLANWIVNDSKLK